MDINEQIILSEVIKDSIEVFKSKYQAFEPTIDYTREIIDDMCLDCIHLKFKFFIDGREYNYNHSFYHDKSIFVTALLHELTKVARRFDVDYNYTNYALKHQLEKDLPAKTTTKKKGKI